MTEVQKAALPADLKATSASVEKVSSALVAKRYRSERRFKFMGMAAIFITGLFLVFLVANLAVKAIPALTTVTVTLPVTIDPTKVSPGDVANGDYPAILRTAVAGLFPDTTSKTEKKKLANLLSGQTAADLQRRITADPTLIGKTITIDAPLSADADMYLKGIQTGIERFKGSTDLKVTPNADKFDLAAANVTFKKGQIVLLPKGSLRVTTDGKGAAQAQNLYDYAPESAAGPGAWTLVQFKDDENSRRTQDQQAAWLEQLSAKGKINQVFDRNFFTNGDSRAPEQAGLLGAFIGSLYVIFLTLIIALPLGVAAALYLEEFARKNLITEIIEVNINNLAAVPSIIFGLLGLAVFLNGFGLPRSSPLVGGLVLALLVLPTIIIASRAAFRSVPPSIKEAALGVGASHQQAVFQHVLPLAVPGILTGTILGVARALGETAPLLMIGMVAFIADLPHGITDASSVLPVQVYLWSTLPEAAFQSRTSLAIICLLIVLFSFNALAIYLRNKFERRW